jgi:hypothetical protein
MIWTTSLGDRKGGVKKRIACLIDKQRYRGFPLNVKGIWTKQHIPLHPHAGS